MVASSPRLSVLVGCFDRTEYLPLALKSIEDQTLSRDEFEVLLVTNLERDKIREIPRTHDITLVQSPGPAGTLVADGVDSASGDVLLFLDDDDLFAPDKLLQVRNLFEHKPELGYYHNHRDLIDANGSRLPDTAYRWRDTRTIRRIHSIEFDSTNLTNSLRVLGGMRADFNLSSISVRRKVLQPFLETCREIRRSPDTFAFFCALASGTKLRVDECRLTRYRIHRQNISIYSTREAQNRPRLTRDSTAETLANYLTISRMLETFGNEQTRSLCQQMVASTALQLSLLADDPSRREVARALLAELRVSSGYLVRTEPAPLLGALVYLFSRRMGKSVRTWYNTDKSARLASQF